jgi:hypothetical protein
MPPSVVNPQTKVELGMVIVLVTAIISAIIAGSVWCTRISIGQALLTEELAQLREVVEAGTGDRWTKTDMRLWVDRANREVELWSVEAEHAFGVEDGEWMRFNFPSVER